MSALSHERNETIDLQQKLARVQSLLEASRRVHSTSRLDEVLAGVLEIAAKELEVAISFAGLFAWTLLAQKGVYIDLSGPWRVRRCQKDKGRRRNRLMPHRF
jgi:hypothetical protein